MEFSALKIIYYLAIILFATKCLGLFTRKFGLPQVAGMVIAGLLIGPAIFGQIDSIPFNGIINPTETEMDVLQTFSQIGVIMILFSSGLETDTKELAKSGFAATLIALIGVLVPLGLGTVLTALFMGGLSSLKDHANMMNALFVGCILSATSVGITVETLRELGKLKTKVGTTVLSAAIIDDVIGIVALSVITSLNGDGSVIGTLIKSVLFFVFAIGIGFPIKYLFVWICKRHPHTRRTSIFALVVCFVYAYIAEEYFGIAAITGAYVAGIMLSGLKDTAFVDKKVLTNGYMIFSPIFFAYIGISADFSQFKPSDLIFGLAFVLVGVLGKILGCGGIAKIFGYSLKDSATIGCGMIARGEVALAVYTTGSMLIKKSGGVVTGIDPLVATIMLIVITSILCPILLKIIFSGKDNGNHEAIPENALHQVSTASLEGGLDTKNY